LERARLMTAMTVMTMIVIIEDDRR